MMNKAYLMDKLRVFILFVFSVTIVSCGRYKQIPYFQNLSLNKQMAENIDNFSSITIQKDDVLGIYVSSLNQEASAAFNMRLTRVNSNNEDVTASNPINPFEGHLVDNNGEIQFPVLGKMKVTGLTTNQLKEQLTEKLKQYLKSPVVTARIINFKISVFGDVGRPDVYQIKNERVTLLEALAMAGDLNITAKRKNVLLIREQDGIRNYIPIDLNSKALFTSDYYYLKSNDVIYVEPDKTKYAPYDIGYRNATLIVAALSVVAIALSTVYR